MSIRYVPQASANSRARIRSRITRNGKFRTETVYREDGMSVAASTDPRTNSTQVYVDGLSVDGEEITLQLTGREARTLRRVLEKHEEYVA